MIKMVYYVTPAEKETELQWLHEQKVYPACQEIFDWVQGTIMVGVGVIVGPEAALAIKLRHELETQIEYRQK